MNSQAEQNVKISELTHSLLPLICSWPRPKDRNKQTSGNEYRHGKMRSLDNGKANWKSFWITLLYKATLPCSCAIWLWGRATLRTYSYSLPCSGDWRQLSSPSLAVSLPLDEKHVLGCPLGMCTHVSRGIPGIKSFSTPPVPSLPQPPPLAISRFWVTGNGTQCQNNPPLQGHTVSALRVKGCPCWKEYSNLRGDQAGTWENTCSQEGVPWGGWLRSQRKCRSRATFPVQPFPVGYLWKSKGNKHDTQFVSLLWAQEWDPRACGACDESGDSRLTTLQSYLG